MEYGSNIFDIEASISNRIYNCKEDAEIVIKELKKKDKDWDYKVKLDPQGSGRAVIEAYDEHGEFVSLL
jgi:hypothetical protein